MERTFGIEKRYSWNYMRFNKYHQINLNKSDDSNASSASYPFTLTVNLAAL